MTPRPGAGGAWPPEHSLAPASLPSTPSPSLVTSIPQGLAGDYRSLIKPQKHKIKTETPSSRVGSVANPRYARNVRGVTLHGGRRRRSPRAASLSRPCSPTVLTKAYRHSHITLTLAARRAVGRHSPSRLLSSAWRGALGRDKGYPEGRGGEGRLVTVFVTCEASQVGVMISSNCPGNQGVFVLRLAPPSRGV